MGPHVYEGSQKKKLLLRMFLMLTALYASSSLADEWTMHLGDMYL